MPNSFGSRGPAGPRGTYVSVGVGGIRYRSRFGRHGGARPEAQASRPGVYNSERIHTASVSDLIDRESAATVSELNKRAAQPPYAWFVGLCAMAFAWLTASQNPALGLMTGILGILAVVKAVQADRMRRTYPLFYELDGAAMQKLDRLNIAIGALAANHRVWRINSIDHTHDRKRNAGAGRLLSRTVAAISKKQPPCMITNVTPFAVALGRQTLYFMPDALYIWEAGRYAAVDYANLAVEATTTRFVETGPVPRDAQVVDRSWRFVNKNGAPDLRFKNNRPIPVALYGVVTLWSDSGLNILLHTSRQAAGRPIAAFFGQSAGPRKDERQSRPRPEPRAPRPEPEKIPPCFIVLGLEAGCTAEEAASAYRQLAKSYHPDLVTHLAGEFRVMAEERMKEINIAYADLKRLKGW